MNDDLFLARVQRCLDARSDPLDDPELAASAAQHPHRLALLVALRADARELAAFRLPPRRRRWPWAAAAACAAAAAVLVATALRAEPPPAGRILAASVTEQRPRAHVAAGCTATERLLATDTHSLTTWTSWSERR